jgi:hypothetical protein
MHGLDRTSCVICSSPGSHIEPRRLPLTVAKFDTRCPACDEPIREGDLIVLDDTFWVHSRCA